MDLCSWPRRIKKKLKTIVEEGEAAPEDIFMEEPVQPIDNIFQVGQRLEAVDKKNPMLLCPARVDGMVGDRLLIAFEGYGDAYSYWCSREDRFIFPCQWHKKTGDELQPVGTDV